MEDNTVIARGIVWGGRIAGGGKVTLELAREDGSGPLGSVLVDEGSVPPYRTVLEVRVAASDEPTA